MVEDAYSMFYAVEESLDRFEISPNRSGSVQTGQRG